MLMVNKDVHGMTAWRRHLNGKKTFDFKIQIMN